MSRQHLSLESFTAIVLEVFVDIAGLELQAFLPVLVGIGGAQVFSHSAGSGHLKSGEAEVARGISRRSGAQGRSGAPGRSGVGALRGSRSVRRPASLRGAGGEGSGAPQSMAVVH